MNNESENSSEQESILAQKHFEKVQAEIEVPDNGPEVKEENKPTDDEFTVPYSRGFGVNKVSFAIFGSFKNQFVMDDSSQYKQYVAASQSSFRVLGMVIPDYTVVLQTLLSWERFREQSNEYKNMIIYYFKLFEENTEIKIVPHYRDYWSIWKIAKNYALKYLDENFVPLKLEYGEGPLHENSKERSREEGKKQKTSIHLFERELKLKQAEIRRQVEKYVIKEALDTWTKNKYKGPFLHKYMGMDGDPDEKFEYCLEESKTKWESWSTDNIKNADDITFTKNEETKNEETKEELKEEEAKTTFIPEEEFDLNLAAYMKILNNFMKEESYSHNMILKGKIMSLIEGIKYNKGIVITGPRCSGKTSIIKGLSYLLRNSDKNIEMRISVLNPDVYSLEKLYGTSESGVMNPEIWTNKDVRISSITSNVLEIAKKGFEVLQKNDGKVNAFSILYIYRGRRLVS